MDKTMENSRKLVLKPDDYVTADWAGNFIYVLHFIFILHIYIYKQLWFLSHDKVFFVINKNYMNIKKTMKVKTENKI